MKKLRTTLDNSALRALANACLLAARNSSNTDKLELKPEHACRLIEGGMFVLNLKIMHDTGTNLAKSRAIITSACNMLQYAREVAPAFGRELYASSADCYVLLSDATKLFCQYVSEMHGEAGTRRWSPVLPELLLSHPEKCGETLALLERKEFKDLSYFQFVVA